MSAAKNAGQGRATFQPFSWFIDGAYNGQDEFVALTKNVCDGLQACLEIVHSTTLEHEHNDMADPGQEVQPLISSSDVDKLMRFAIASAGMMANEADRRIEFINDRRRREANK